MGAPPPFFFGGGQFCRIYFNTLFLLFFPFQDNSDDQDVASDLRTHRDSLLPFGGFPGFGGLPSLPALEALNKQGLILPVSSPQGLLKGGPSPASHLFSHHGFPPLRPPSQVRKILGPNIPGYIIELFVLPLQPLRLSTTGPALTNEGKLLGYIMELFGPTLQSQWLPAPEEKYIPGNNIEFSPISLATTAYRPCACPHSVNRKIIGKKYSGICHEIFAHLFSHHHGFPPLRSPSQVRNNSFRDISWNFRPSLSRHRLPPLCLPSQVNKIKL